MPGSGVLVKSAGHGTTKVLGQRASQCVVLVNVGRNADPMQRVWPHLLTTCGRMLKTTWSVRPNHILP